MFKRQFNGHLALAGLAVFVLAALVGCTHTSPDVSSESAGKKRINNLLRLYKAYVDTKKKGPPDEQSLREFGAKLTSEEKASFLIDEDIDSLFTSPRDNKKYVVRYNMKLEPGGPVKAVAYEAEGQGGRKYVALTMGYVEEYGDAMVQEYVNK